jgi:type IV pilus assembly protein PilA
MNIQHKEKGFTIIEVVLVLAIAGLIFLMVFIALPALQRNQRDTARKNDVASVASGVTTYTGNNRGTFPTTTTLSSYVTDVSSNTTTVNVNGTTGAQNVAPADGTVTVTARSKCGTSGTNGYTVVAGTARQFTVVTRLESGNGAYFCQDS